MKVICIDGKPTTVSISLPEGVPLDASQSDLWDNCYLIDGYMIDPVSEKFVHWGKRRFIPLSEIDETEMERNYNTQHA